MKIILTESQINKIIQLNEIETAAFDIKKWDVTDVTTYEFVANNLKYHVDIEPYDSSEDGSGYYYISFDFHKPKDSLYNSNLNIKHLNTVIYTVIKIIEDFVGKNPNIDGLIIHAINDNDRGETEDDNNNIRTRMYTRFIKQSNLKYKSLDVDDNDNRIFIDLK